MLKWDESVGKVHTGADGEEDVGGLSSQRIKGTEGRVGESEKSTMLNHLLPESDAQEGVKGGKGVSWPPRRHLILMVSVIALWVSRTWESHR